MKELSNQELVAALEKLKGRENQIIAELVRYLSEVDRRRLYFELGYPSLFAYCCKALGYSESVVPPVEVKERAERSRYIPADVRHEVERRDGGRCTYIAPDGTRCCETRNLEFDHEHPFALCGENTVKNLRLVCRGHNRMYAEQVVGREYLENVIHSRQ